MNGNRLDKATERKLNDIQHFTQAIKVRQSSCYVMTAISFIAPRLYMNELRRPGGVKCEPGSGLRNATWSKSNQLIVATHSRALLLWDAYINYPQRVWASISFKRARLNGRSQGKTQWGSGAVMQRFSGAVVQWGSGAVLQCFMCVLWVNNIFLCNSRISKKFI